jgi:hypothetical protein
MPVVIGSAVVLRNEFTAGPFALPISYTEMSRRTISHLNRDLNLA